jgi:hypothetical protein
VAIVAVLLTAGHASETERGGQVRHGELVVTLGIRDRTATK